MEKTKTERPIDFIRWQNGKGFRFLLLPEKGYHVQQDVTLAKKWLIQNNNSNYIIVEWQGEGSKVHTEGFVMRSQSKKNSPITAQKKIIWLEIKHARTRLCASTDKYGDLILRFECDDENRIITFDDLMEKL